MFIGEGSRVLCLDDAQAADGGLVAWLFSVSAVSGASCAAPHCPRAAPLSCLVAFGVNKDALAIFAYGPEELAVCALQEVAGRAFGVSPLWLGCRSFDLAHKLGECVCLDVLAILDDVQADPVVSVCHGREDRRGALVATTGKGPEGPCVVALCGGG